MLPNFCGDKFFVVFLLTNIVDKIFPGRKIPDISEMFNVANLQKCAPQRYIYVIWILSTDSSHNVYRF